MARMHSHKKGQSGSTRPSKQKIASWLRYKGREVEVLVTRLAKEGLPPSQIGIHLRDRYGVPDVKEITKKSITQILKEKNLQSEFPEDLMALIKRNISIRAHMERNNSDTAAKRGLMLTDAKIRRLIKYYKKTGKLAADWKYDPERIKLFLE